MKKLRWGEAELSRHKADPLGRPSAGYTCPICGFPVVARIGFFEDECTGCGTRLPCKKFYANHEEYNKVVRQNKETSGS